MTAQSKSAMTLTLPSDTEILMTREFNAPRRLVFKAFTDPELIPRWWGMRSHTTVVDKMDVRPGGAWRYVCRDDEGNELAFRGVYQEVVPPEKLVYTFEFEPMAGQIMTETLTFEESHGRTRITSRARCASKEDRDGMIQSGMEAGAAESYDRLEELLRAVS